MSEVPSEKKKPVEYMETLQTELEEVQAEIQHTLALLVAAQVELAVEKAIRGDPA
jgi:hypothetical protein